MGMVAVGAFMGAFISAARGGKGKDLLRGAVLGGAGAAIGGAVAGGAGGEAGGLVEGAGATTAELGAEASFATTAESLAAAEAANTGVALAVAPSATQQAAQGLLEGQGVAAPAVQSPAQEFLEEPGVAAPTAQSPAQEVMGGSPTPTPKVPTSSTTPLPTSGPPSPGLWNEVLQWAKNNKEVAAAVVQTGGGILAGIGRGMGDYMTAERKAQLDLENKQKLTDYYRKFVQSGSAGGVGVKLGMSPANVGALKPASGGLVRRSFA